MATLHEILTAWFRLFFSFFCGSISYAPLSAKETKGNIILRNLLVIAQNIHSVSNDVYYICSGLSFTHSHIQHNSNYMSIDRQEQKKRVTHKKKVNKKIGVAK